MTNNIFARFSRPEYIDTFDVLEDNKEEQLKVARTMPIFDGVFAFDENWKEVKVNYVVTASDVTITIPKQTLLHIIIG